MKNYNIKVILEENKGLDDSILTQSDGYKGNSTPSLKKRQSLSKSELQTKYLRKDFDFSSEEDLQVIFDIIQKQNSLKSNIDLMILQNAFKNIRLFQELANEIPEKQMFNLYRELLHYEYQPRQIVFNQGEIGREFFIILKGAVYIIGNEDKKQVAQNAHSHDDAQQDDQEVKECVEQKEEENRPVQPLVQTNTSKLARKLQKKSTFHMFQQKQEQNEQNSETSLPRQPSIVRQPSIQRQGTFQYNYLKRISSLVYDIDHDITDEEYIKENFPEYDILAKLEAGTSFGEVALRDSVPRTATAICSGETHFITLKRDAFKRFLEQYYSVVQQQNISFVKKISLYKNWTEQMINQMFYYLEKKTFRMNQTIFKEGSDSLGIFLIRNGEVKLYQEMQLSSDKHDKLKNVRHFMRKTDSTKSTNLFQAPVSHLGEGQMFGHEDIVNQAQRKYSAVCSSSSCTLLFLNKDNAAEESAMKEQWHREITSKLESFSKNQNEFFKKQELNKKKTQETFEMRRNSQIYNKKQSLIFSPMHRGVNRSLPTITQISLMQISQDEVSPKMTNIKQINCSLDYNKSYGLILNDEVNIDCLQDAKVYNHLQRISSIATPQTKLIWDSKNKTKYEFSDACISPATAENTPLQSEIYIRSSTKNSQQKFTNDNLIINPEDNRVITEISHKQRPSSDISFDTQSRTDTRQISSNNNQSLNQPHNTMILNQSQSNLYITPQKSPSQLHIQPQLMYDNTSPQYMGHRRFLSYQQDNLNKIVDNSTQSYNYQATIRKSSIQKDRVKQQIEDSLHVPKKMQQSLSQLCELSQNNIDEFNQPKLDIDNQMIPVCSSVMIFRKRVENKYPQLVSYSKPSSQPSSSTQINDIQIQQRILKSLKLPKVRKSAANLMDIFKPINSESKKNLNLENDEQQINIQPFDKNELQSASALDTPQKQHKRNHSLNSKSIIDTLHKMKQKMAEKKAKAEYSQTKAHEFKEKLSLQLLENKFHKKKDQSLSTNQKSVFDVKNLKVANYSFLDKFNEISHTPTALKQALLLSNNSPCNK